MNDNRTKVGQQVLVLLEGPTANDIGRLVASGGSYEAKLQVLQAVDENGNFDFLGDPLHVRLGDLEFCRIQHDEVFPLDMSAQVLDGSDNIVVDGIELLGARVYICYGEHVRTGVLRRIMQERRLEFPDECYGYDHEGGGAEVRDNFLTSLGIRGEQEG